MVQFGRSKVNDFEAETSINIVPRSLFQAAPR